MTRQAYQDQWMEHVLGQRASGKTKSVFCREQNLNVQTFYRWSRKIRETKPSNPAVVAPMGQGFARVEVSRAAQRFGVTVRLPSGVVIESDAGYPDPQWLTAVVCGLLSQERR